MKASQKLAQTSSQFVYKIYATLACEQTPDCVAGEGTKQEGRYS